MKTSELNLISQVEKLAFISYQDARLPHILSESVSRIAAALLSPAAICDAIFHALMIAPTCLYAIGKSLYLREMDFTLPWQHLQRVRNAVAPILLGSLCGLLHPYFGLVVSEPTDKHAVIGMLSSNTDQFFETPCSPIHSLSILETLAQTHQYAEKDEKREEIFSAEHVQLIKDAKYFEKSLESLHAQEFMHKITNITLCAMHIIMESIQRSRLSPLNQEIWIRASGLLIPVLTAVDMAIVCLVQTFFMLTGVVQAISGRSPVYTEVTIDPLMHASFLIQNILKTVGNLLGTVVWFVSPLTGFKLSLMLPSYFFKMQFRLLMMKIRLKMHFAANDSCFAIPIVFGNGVSSTLSFPTHNTHKTYLIVEKKEDKFNLYWVNRPSIYLKPALNVQEAYRQIQSMIEERFPYMDIEKMMNYPVISKEPQFLHAISFKAIRPQGNSTNCVVSNLFGMLEAFDRIKGASEELTRLRYKQVRQALMKDYDFYKKDFFPFEAKGSLLPIYDQIERYPEVVI